MAYQSIIPADLGQAPLTGTIATVYTVPAATRALLKCFDLANTTGAAITVDVHKVPSGGGATTANAIMIGVSVAANSTLQWTGLQVMLPGATLQARASAVGVTISASGGEAT